MRVFWLAVAVLVAVSCSHWLAEAQPYKRYDAPVPVPTRVVKTIPPLNSNKTDAAPAEETPVAYSVKAPNSVKQGEVLVIDINDPEGRTKGGKAYLAGRGANIYSKGENDYFALVSVDIYQKPGGYKLAIQDYNGETIYKQPVEVVDEPQRRRFLLRRAARRVHAER